MKNKREELIDFASFVIRQIDVFGNEQTAKELVSKYEEINSQSDESPTVIENKAIEKKCNSKYPCTAVHYSLCECDCNNCPEFY